VIGGKKVGVFHPGTQHSWQTALAFQGSGQLAWYATSVFYDSNRWPYRLESFLPEGAAKKVSREFRRRHTPYLDISKVRQFGIWEWLETGLSRLDATRFAGWANRRGNIAFSRSVIDLIEREPVDVAWGYDDASLEVFRWAKRQGVFCVLDQSTPPLAYKNQVMLEEWDRNPEFFQRPYIPEPQARIERQNEELALADLVVVGSEFCARTIIEAGLPSEKVRIVPYGFDASLFPKEPPLRRPLRGRPVEFLFVGGVRPAKGVAYLLKAIAKIPPAAASLALLGGLHIPKATFGQYADRVRYIPPVPRPKVVGYFASADCFIFPSLFEGGGLVLYEANAGGLGIVQTAACGDGVRDGRNGIVLSDISLEALQQAIDVVLNEPAKLVEWQRASWEMRSDRTWQRYHDRLKALPIF
jgi:glycosyltransferase involved in cell wall biosynthesis